MECLVCRSEYSAFWKCIRAGVAYLITQIVKVCWWGLWWAGTVCVCDAVDASACYGVSSWSYWRRQKNIFCSEFINEIGIENSIGIFHTINRNIITCLKCLSLRFMRNSVCFSPYPISRMRTLAGLTVFNWPITARHVRILTLTPQADQYKSACYGLVKPAISLIL